MNTKFTLQKYDKTFVQICVAGGVIHGLLAVDGDRFNVLDHSTGRPLFSVGFLCYCFRLEIIGDSPVLFQEKI